MRGGGGGGLVTVQHETVYHMALGFETKASILCPGSLKLKCNTNEPHHHSFAQVPAVYTPPLKSWNKLSTWQTMVYRYRKDEQGTHKGGK